MKSLHDLYNKLYESDDRPYDKNELNQITQISNDVVNGWNKIGMINVPFKKWKVDINDEAAEVEYRNRNGGKFQILWQYYGDDLTISLTSGGDDYFTTTGSFKSIKRDIEREYLRRKI